MGVQHRDRPSVALELRIVVGKRIQRLLTAAHHQVVQGALLLPGQHSELPGQSKGDEEILGRHLFFELPLQPLLALIDRSLNAA